MKFWLTLVILSVGFTTSCTRKQESAIQTTPSTQKPSLERVFFVSPNDNSEVSAQLKVIMGVVGKSVRPAGEDLADQTSGHHHLIIDGKSIAKGEVIPADEKHIHFGKGQTETEVTLTPGPHTLTLQFADGAHRSYGEELSATISVTVK